MANRKWMVPTREWIQREAAAANRPPALVLWSWLRQNGVPRDEWQGIGQELGLHPPLNDEDLEDPMQHPEERDAQVERTNRTR